MPVAAASVSTAQIPSAAHTPSVRSPLTAAIATFALNAAECVRRVLFVIFLVPLSALSPAQAPSVPLIRLSEFARPPLRLLPKAATGEPATGSKRVQPDFTLIHRELRRKGVTLQLLGEEYVEAHAAARSYRSMELGCRIASAPMI
jgi:hypothetical protein